MKQEVHTLEAQRERLVEFRAKHPHKELTVADVRWEHIACRRGNETLLLLNGGTDWLGPVVFRIERVDNA